MATISAGTYDAKVCVSCTDGTTVTYTETSAPHPTYTNTNGDSVVQTTAITLGGFNGLNN
jgi:hypothetical protein